MLFSNLLLVKVDDDPQALVSGNQTNIEEILQISLEDVNITVKEVDYCS